MDENRARRVADALRERGIDAHLENAGIDIYGVRVVLPDRREAIWGNEGTASLEAEVLLDGDLVGFVPEIPGSEAFDDAQVVDAIARADYDQPEGRERPDPAPGEPLVPGGWTVPPLYGRLPVRLRVMSRPARATRPGPDHPPCPRWLAATGWLRNSPGDSRAG